MIIHNSTITFNTDNIKPTKFYRYRTARIKTAFMKIGKWDDDNSDRNKFIAKLCEELGESLDNHIVIETQIEDTTVYFGYNDGVISVGFGIIEETW